MLRRILIVTKEYSLMLCCLIPIFLGSILLLLALVLGGCEVRQTPTEYTERVFGIPLTKVTKIKQDTIPCPPCPDTVRLFMQPDSSIVLEGGVEIYFTPPDTVYRMPLGRWVKMSDICLAFLGIWSDSLTVTIYGIPVDSVFIPDQPGEEEP